MSRKRRRVEAETNQVVIRSAKRPINKGLVHISNAVDNSIGQQDLFTVTFPCTVLGIRWDMTLLNGTTQCIGGWAIIVIRDGLSPGALALSAGADFYTPEQDVLAYGAYSTNTLASADGSTRTWVGNTKTMRKLMAGDKLSIVFQGSAAVSGTLSGVIQFFCKS